MFQVVSQKHGKLATPFRHKEAMEIVSKQTDGFGVKLAKEFHEKGVLSMEQWYWVHKLAIQATPTEKVSQGISVGKILELFDAASKHLKHPKIRLRAADGSAEFRVMRATSASKYPGAFNVVGAGSYQDREWYGRITQDGTLQRGKKMTDAMVEVLRRFSDDPVAVAGEYGALLGSCCFCGHTLEEEGSIAVGYGPVCARHFGLQHPQNDGGMIVVVPETVV